MVDELGRLESYLSQLPTPLPDRHIQLYNNVYECIFQSFLKTTFSPPVICHGCGLSATFSLQ